jgi:hypothetical protein
MVSARMPPVMNIVKLNHRYIVPMSLWFVGGDPAHEAARMMRVLVVVRGRGRVPLPFAVLLIQIRNR